MQVVGIAVVGTLCLIGLAFPSLAAGQQLSRVVCRGADAMLRRKECTGDILPKLGWWLRSSRRHGSSIFSRSLRAAAILPSIVLVLAVVVTQLAQAQTFTILYSFTDGLDGAHPYAGLTMDRAGNFYGTAEYGGSYQSGYICELNPREPGCGTVFKLPKQGARWIFSPLVDFQGTNGSYPQAGVTIGPYGNLYGITFSGGTFGGACGAFGCGTVFHLRPPSTICRTALCPWTDIVVYPFTGGSDGSQPLSGLIFDQAGNIYGTNVGGPDSCGGVYELSPSGSGWTYTVLYNFACGGEEISPGGLIFDSRGNLYGSQGSAAMMGALHGDAARFLS